MENLLKLMIRMNKYMNKVFEWIKEFFEDYHQQPSKAWCECGHEVLQDPLSKIYEGGTFTNIICSRCNVQTTWNLDTPVPLFIKSTK